MSGAGEDKADEKMPEQIKKEPDEGIAESVANVETSEQPTITDTALSVPDEDMKDTNSIDADAAAEKPTESQDVLPSDSIPPLSASNPTSPQPAGSKVASPLPAGSKTASPLPAGSKAASPQPAGSKTASPQPTSTNDVEKGR